MSVVAPVLSVRDLVVHYFTRRGPVQAVDGISFDLIPGETLGLVGESGCGKSTVGAALLNMPAPPGRIVSGSIRVAGMEAVGMGETELRRRLRWTRIAMVFQGAMSCLTPVYTIRALMRETLRAHAGGAWAAPEAATRRTAAEVEHLLRRSVDQVGLPAHVLDRYPHELSGGMKQRIVIAMALFLEPPVVVLDEPTTALDVIVQAQILNLVKTLKRDRRLSCLFITHDLSIEAEVADRVMVMYAGHIAEVGTNWQIFSEDGPRHPYTRMLLAATPRLHRRVSELAFIPGVPPDLLDPPRGCRFAARCPFAREKCRRDRPPLVEIEERHHVACFKAAGDAEYER